MNKISFATISCALVIYAASAHGSDAGLRHLNVEATVNGTLRAFSGVTGAPGAEFGELPASAPKLDITEDYKRARVDLIRTHDAFGPGDIDARFGTHEHLPISIPADRDGLVIFPDMSADADDPKNYHFEPTDRMMASIKAVGAETIFRIGRSIGADPSPPADPDKYANISRHIVMHYNRGWARGFHYGLLYWEVWNEPDFRVFWTGTAQQYYDLYAKTVRAIKSVDSKALVGGPTIAMPLDATPYREGFLDFVRAKKLPLDFFSWHFYALDSNDPESFVEIGRTIRSLLDKNGFQATKSVLDEWNVDLFDRDLSKASRAAFATSSLIYMLNAPIDLQAYYRADRAFRNSEHQPDAVGQALMAFGMMKNTPVLLNTTGGDDVGFGLLAGRSRDGRTLQILISNYQIAPKLLGVRPHGDMMHIPDIMDITLPPRRAIEYHENAGYDLKVTVPAGKFRVTRFRISDVDRFRAVDQGTQTGPTLQLKAQLPPPAIELLRIQSEQ